MWPFEGSSLGRGRGSGWGRALRDFADQKKKKGKGLPYSPGSIPKKKVSALLQERGLDFRQKKKESNTSLGGEGSPGGKGKSVIDAPLMERKSVP